MSDETDLDELSIIKRGYERFLSSPGDLGNCENAIITVRRQQQITTHFGPLTTKNKIKVSLSQEQILNQTNRYPPNIKRSQSTNIQRTLFSSGGVIRNSIRPSLIPVKIKEQPRLRALTLTPHQEDQTDTDLPKYRSVRKMSAPFERRNYVSQQETTLSSLPMPMTQSLDPNLHSGKSRDEHRDLDKFKCGICLNILCDSRVLNCLHTFCLECLYSIENINTPKTTPSKLNPSQRSNSIEIKDERSSNCSEESKESERKISKSVASHANKPIRKIYTTTPRPKTLKVQQKRPLSSITEKSKVTLKCPICGLRTEIPIGGVSRVPKNFLLERQLQHEIHKLQALCLTDKNCSQCYEEIEAVAYCLNCEVSLCDVCHEAHLRQRWTSKHSLIALPDLKSKQIDVLKEKQFGQNSNAPLKCFIHPTQDLKLFCGNCNQVACHNCTILLHKGHKFESIERARQRIFKKFQESLERNQKYHEYINGSVSKLAGCISKINDRAEIVEMEIEIFLKDYIDALDAHRESLFRQIYKAKELKTLSITEQMEYLQKRAQESKQANIFAENLLRNGNDVEILTFIGTLQNRFDFCQKTKIPAEPTISDTFQFIREVRAPITPRQHNIPIFGVLATQEIDAS